MVRSYFQFKSFSSYFYTVVKDEGDIMAAMLHSSPGPGGLGAGVCTGRVPAATECIAAWPFASCTAAAWKLFPRDPWCLCPWANCRLVSGRHFLTG